MELPLLGKLNSPLPLFIGLMTGGILLVGVATYAIIETPNTKQSEINELTVAAKQQQLNLRIQASGTVEPIQSVNISPKNPGLLARLLVEQGNQVKQGQTLAVMENAEIQAQGIQAQANVKQAFANLKEAETRIPSEVNQAQARFVQAQARLKEAQASLPRQIDQARAQVGSAQARFTLAKERLNRYQYLVEQGAVTKDRFEEAVNEFRDSEANLFEAQQRLEQEKNTARPEIEQLGAAVAEAQLEVEQRKKNAQDEMAQLSAALEAAQAQLKIVEVQFRNTIINAPFDGIITQKYATEGSFVTPTTSASNTASATSTSILALAKGLEVIAKVPEVDIGQLQPGQPVEIIADAYPEQVFRGKVRLIAPEAIVEQNVTSFEIRIALFNGQGKLRSKMNVDATFLGNQINNALVVPTVAIVTEEGKTGVLVPDEDNKPKFKPVIVGITLDDKTQILQGLNQGERVFIDLPQDYERKDKD